MRPRSILAFQALQPAVGPHPIPSQTGQSQAHQPGVRPRIMMNTLQNVANAGQAIGTASQAANTTSLPSTSGTTSSHGNSGANPVEHQAAQSGGPASSAAVVRKPPILFELDHFKFTAVIGKGSFSQVQLNHAIHVITSTDRLPRSYNRDNSITGLFS